MKRYIYKAGLFAIGLATVLMSCEEDTVTYNGENFISFSNVSSTNFNVKEDGGIANIPVNIAFPLSTDLVINFTVTSDVAVAGTHYNVLTPSITIPAGATTANIQIDIIDNEEVDESRPLFLTLTGTSDPSITVGIADAGSKEKRVLIVNDDCTTEFDIWLGNLIFTEGGDVTNVTADVNQNGDCNILVLDGDFAGFGQNPAFKLTLTFAPTTVGATRGTVTLANQSYCTACNGGLDLNIEGSGTYNEVTGIISLTYRIVRSDGAGAGPYTVVIRAAN